MDEIRQFAANVVPKPRFIFDNYKVDESKYSDSADDGELSDVEKTERDELAKIQQQKHDSDYFSFFNSHENIILKPESNFKGLRTFLTHLPIDYYILLQQGYDKKDKHVFEPSKYIYCENIPLFTKKSTYFKSSSPIKTILMEDIYKCSNRYQAECLLEDPYAVEVMLEHLAQRYGEIEEHFFVNYDIGGILSKVGLSAKANDGETLALKSPVETELQATLESINKQKGGKGSQSSSSFEMTTDTESILEVENFESLMLSLDKQELSGAKGSSTFTEYDDEEHNEFK